MICDGNTRPRGSRTTTWYMRSVGSIFAISAKGTDTTERGRAASSVCVTVILAPDAKVADAPSVSAAAAPRFLAFMLPPGLEARLWHRDQRIDHRPEGPLGIALAVEQQRVIGPGDGEAVEPGVVVGKTPERDRLDAGPVEGGEQRAIGQ